MNLIRFALQKPITILVIVAGLFFFGIKAVNNIKVDIFPKLDLPVIYVSHPFGGYTPEQMETNFGKSYNSFYNFVNGLKKVETKNIQGLSLMKLTFYPGTNMAQAAAELTALTTRAQNGFPPGSNPPFIIRFDASTLPIGQLVLSSDTRNNNELLDLAFTYVRSGFTSIPGLVASPPMGGNARTVVINANPELLRQHHISPDQLVEAMRLNNQQAPAGNIRIGKKNYMTPSNTNIRTVKEFEEIPLFSGDVQNLYLRDVATVTDGADVTTGYALVNGRRSVYLSIAKAADASTWEVVNNLKKSIPSIQSQLPEDVKLEYVFDQSVYVVNAVESLIEEGVIGAILTGLMVFLFLRDARGALIVILTIPTAIVSGVLFLNLFGQTINIMTLSGLALAIGILVDESTVTIENIHQHLSMGKKKSRAIADACMEIAFPKLLILLCILAVFAPAFTMTGIPGSLFMPLALAIGFSMIVSYFLSQTFVPVLANWLMKGKVHHQNAKKNIFDKVKDKYVILINRLMPFRKQVVIIYLLASSIIVVSLLTTIGRDVLPRFNSNQFQLRLREPDGTRIEETEKKTIKFISELNKLVGEDKVLVSSTFVGLHPQGFSVNPIYLWTSGPHEALLQVALKEGSDIDMDNLKDQVREMSKKQFPEMSLSFEPIELTDKILSQGSPTPVEVRLTGRDKQLNVTYARKVEAELKKIDYLRDVQLGQSVDYPTIDINIDRVKAAQFGISLNDITRSLIASTSSSRLTEKNIWVDKKAGSSYMVQVTVPENQMNSMGELSQIPLSKNSEHPILGDIATFTEGRTFGELDNLGAMPSLTVTANIKDNDLGKATEDVKKAIANLGDIPRGLTIEPIGLGITLTDTLDNLQSGLLVAIIVIFLMLAANFQSFKVSGIVLVTVPAVLLGSLTLLMCLGSTLNLQSYMGMIMSVGVSISNAVLLITNAEQLRRSNGNALESAVEAASLRFRPIVMTAIAMVVGMIPMASGLGETGGQTSPLGRAVIGGLFLSTIAAVLVLPLAFAWVQGNSRTQSISLDPDDKDSTHFDNKTNNHLS